jgi:hypothetical protein
MFPGLVLQEMNLNLLRLSFQRVKHTRSAGADGRAMRKQTHANLWLNCVSPLDMVMIEPGITKYDPGIVKN